jgi:hypothetical protein
VMSPMSMPCRSLPRMRHALLGLSTTDAGTGTETAASASSP